MNETTYKTRINSSLRLLEPLICKYGFENELTQIKLSLNTVTETTIETHKKATLDLLNKVLEAVQVEFAQMEDPDESDTELFRSYLQELKEYRQEISSPSSKTRRDANMTLKRSRRNFLNEINIQSVMFTTECLDTILESPEFFEENGVHWAEDQVNQTLNSILEQVDSKLEASFECVNNIYGQEIFTLEDQYVQNISIGQINKDPVSDNIFSLVRQSLPAIGITGAGSALVGLLNPVVGVVAGLTAGTMFIYKATSSASKQKKKIEVKSKIAPKITVAMNELSNYVNDRFDDYEENLLVSIESMTEKINKEMQDCMMAIQSCEEDKKQFNVEQEQLYRQTTLLEQQIKQVELLLTNPFNK